MAAPTVDKHVELGFVEETDKFLLKSRFFPSKVGGRPAWLSLKSLPTPEELSCSLCSKLMKFLMQIYSPDPSKESCFHRTIFIFVCDNTNCCKSNCAGHLVVFRSQLQQINEFYSSKPPVEARVDKEIDASLHNKLCRVCGCLGPKTCGKCHKVSYCSKEHQAVDWKENHKQECSSDSAEFELVTETENVPTKGTKEKNDATKMKEYEEFLKSAKGSDAGESLPDSELQSMAGKGTDNDKQLLKFKERISFEPEQVLRYDKGGEPLWIAHSPKPQAIPDCDCGAKRQFEFQVLPHLLSHLNVDRLGASLDWGTLCVYTCVDSCETGNQYKREFIFKQDVI
ncbi:PDCD2-like protein [Mya arenaria]|uniref:PDCD2-like protein n=1 Tax=Mya arenaria TaxID=6604 RepID=A0ABY7FQD4_MYAAR|nr:PDCD2-like protein [Mya arenaria]